MRRSAIRWIGAVGRVGHRAINQAIGRLECALSDGGEHPLEYRPILIIGPPRSGSTLLMQVLAHSLDVGYLTNAHAWCFGAPSWAERFICLPRRNRRIDFESAHGRTRGWMSPSECGDWWYRFFRRQPQYVTMAEVDALSLRRLRAATRSIGCAMQRPLVFKNLPCAVRLQPIAAALPEALFVVTHRDLADNAQSILHARRRTWGTYAPWWSTQPPTIAELRKLPPAEQVVRQVIDIHAQIQHDRRMIDESRFVDVGYDRLCVAPGDELERVARFVAGHGTALGRRAAPPQSFEMRRPPDLEPAMRKQLTEVMQQHITEP